MVTKGNVLVVDDEINLCRIIGAKLARNGYSVVAVHDGLQAVEKVRESDFDVVLLDLILPKMDGLSALAEIRNMRQALPIIVMTACENADALEQARHYGVSAYVNKPFDLDTLVSLVTNTSQSSVGVRARKLPDSTVLFAAEQPITLEVQNGGSAKIYGSRICDKGDRTLSVLAPRCQGVAVEIPPRTTVRIALAARDAFYSFGTQVLSVSDRSDDMLVLDKPSVIYRIQRRAHPRSLLRIPVDYAVRLGDDEEFGELKQGETLDMSVGGASILVDDEICAGKIVKIELRPKTERDTISAVAQVLRSRFIDEPGQSGYILGCQFILADPSFQKYFKE